MKETIENTVIPKSQIYYEELHVLILNNKSLKFSKRVLMFGQDLQCEVSTSNIQPYRPESYRITEFHLFYDICHPGRKKNLREYRSVIQHKIKKIYYYTREYKKKIILFFKQFKSEILQNFTLHFLKVLFEVSIYETITIRLLLLTRKTCLNRQVMWDVTTTQNNNKKYVNIIYILNSLINKLYTY